MVKLVEHGKVGIKYFKYFLSRQSRINKNTHIGRYIIKIKPKIGN